MPRGNQADITRVITTHGLTSRQSGILVDAFSKARDQQEQQYIREHPMEVIEQQQSDQQEIYDPRLSAYGNDLLQSVGYAQKSIHILLSRLDDLRSVGLSDSEKIILTPGLEKVSNYYKKLTEAITHLQIHKTKQQDER